VGAVLGWFDPLLIFFIAPFSGILWTVLSMGLGRVLRSVRRELPYGPHLALATVVVILCRPGINQFWQASLGAVPRPQPGLCQAVAPTIAPGASRPVPPGGPPGGAPGGAAATGAGGMGP